MWQAHHVAWIVRGGAYVRQARWLPPADRPEGRETLVQVIMDQRADLPRLIARDPHNTQRIMRRMDVLGETRSPYAQTAYVERAKRSAAAGVGRFLADGPDRSPPTLDESARGITWMREDRVMSEPTNPGRSTESTC